MVILVTGSAGFIGSQLVKKLLSFKYDVIGIDNHNDYYDVRLKEDRLKEILIDKKYIHYRLDLSNSDMLHEVFKNHKVTHVVNLAAQAGVRYSIENPRSYINSNIVGFANILEESRNSSVKHLIYASSSSVYGANTSLPYRTTDTTDHPLSLYAATKKSNELMAHSYSHLYDLPTTGLRFFSVYGPWGRPDMAIFKFTKSILNGEPIKIFNNGNHIRDFTYIDDVVEAILRATFKPAKKDLSWNGLRPSLSSSSAPWKIYNVGGNRPIKLMDCISILERSIGAESIKEFLPYQLGDAGETFADMDSFIDSFDFEPSVSIDKGVDNFVKWYKDYYSF